MLKRGLLLGSLLILNAAVGSQSFVAQTTTSSTGEWRFYGGDAHSTKYSPLDRINKANVKDLRVAWRWKTDNFGPVPDYNYEVTPLMIGGVLYTTAGTRRDVVAIDAATGETLWMFRFDDGVRGQRAPIRPAAGRGVAYWTDGVEARILHVTRGYYLVALDAKTGRPVATFGTNGVVDLFDGLDQPVPQPGQIGLNSPPIVVRDTIVVGAALTALSPSQEFVAGFIRGYDVRTGKRNWVFHTVPRPGEVGNDTWEKDSWSYTGHTGAWAPMSADEDLGYVYLPVETPTNDYYGGHRPGAGLFGESLVALDAKTGKRIWHYQLVHHGIWDYDIPCPPILVDITVDGRRIKAVAQVTKQAFTYVFDRENGRPVWPIEERAVPQSDTPGEKTSLTQPIPRKPAPFDRQGVTVDDLIDFTPELKAEAVKMASQYRLGPVFTPAVVAGHNGLKGTLVLPFSGGGANWQGGAVDPETGVLYVASATDLVPLFLTPGGQRSSMNYVGNLGGPERDNQRVTNGASGPSGEAAARNEAAIATRAFGPQGLPMAKPPWGRITAIDLNTGEHLWMVANGDAPEYVRNHPALKGVNIPKTGTPERGGIFVTKTLVFAGEGSGLWGGRPGAGGPMFRAYDKKTGEVVAELRLPANQSGVPMTYMAGGRQYIVVPVGAKNSPSELVALAVP